MLSSILFWPPKPSGPGKDKSPNSRQLRSPRCLLSDRSTSPDSAKHERSKSKAESLSRRGSGRTCSRTSNCWQKKKTYDLYLTAMTTLTTNENRTPLRIVAAIIASSAAASLFLCWLVYYHAPVDVTGTHLLFLPALRGCLKSPANAKFTDGVQASWQLSGS